VNDIDQLEWEIGDLLKADEIHFIHNLAVRKPSYCIEALRACLMKGFARNSAHHFKYGPHAFGPTRVSSVEEAAPNFWPTTMMAANAMEANVMELVGCLGTCNRIKTSPVPSIHTSVMRAFTLLYCSAIPFAFGAPIGWIGIVILMLFGWLALGVQDAADKLEQPFGHDDCDLQLNVFCEAIRTSVFDTYDRFHGAIAGSTDAKPNDQVPWELHEGPAKGDLPQVHAGAMTMEAQMRALYDGRPQMEFLLRQPSHREDYEHERGSLRKFKQNKQQQQQQQHFQSAAVFARQAADSSSSSSIVAAAAKYGRSRRLMIQQSLAELPGVGHREIG